jgi:8-oxo-dGTP diphosphatase
MRDFPRASGHNAVMAENIIAPVPRPLVGVGAVIWNENGEIVLIRRGQAPRRGDWSIPGGKLEWGESVKEGLLREVREETALRVEITGLIDVVDSLTRDASGNVAHHYVLIDFSARHVGGTLAAGADAADARWVRFDDIGAYALWTETRRIIETARVMRG